MKNYNYSVHITVTPDTDKPLTSIHHGICKGAYDLLDGVNKGDSLFKVCRDQGMAYSKAWKLIKNVEEDFDCKLLEHRGESVAHGSIVTEDGLKLMQAYEDAMATATEAVSKLNA